MEHWMDKGHVFVNHRLRKDVKVSMAVSGTIGEYAGKAPEDRVGETGQQDDNDIPVYRAYSRVKR